MAARLICAAKTDVGLKRTNNEDNLIMVPGQGLYVLADGMGGHASGQVASTMCVSHVAKFICEMARQPGFELPFRPNPQISAEANLLVNAIKFANERIYIQSCKDRSMEGMGTTVTAIYNAVHGLVLAHVGDSRIYRIRKGQIVQMSRDHSLLNHLIDKGELKPEDAKNFPQKNVILRAIGLKETVEVDVKEVPREDGDIYLMCSDGLSDLVEAPVIAKTVTEAPNLTEACNQLIGLALQAGGKDNVTVVCVGINGKDDPMARPVPDAKPLQQNVITTVPNMPQKPPAQTRKPPAQFVAEAAPPVPSRAAAPGCHPGMAPLPKGRPSVPSMQPVAESRQEKPVRMHSVREIVKYDSGTNQKAVLKNAPRTSAASMPAVPMMRKVKAVVQESEEAEAGQNAVGKAPGVPASPQKTPSELSSPKILRIPEAPKNNASSGQSIPKLPSVKKELPVAAAPVWIKKESGTEDDMPEALPDAKLLFTNPPVAAETCDADEDEDKTVILSTLKPFDPPPEFVPEYVDEDACGSEMDDCAHTILDCPIVKEKDAAKPAPIPKQPLPPVSRQSSPSVPHIKAPSASSSSVMPAVSSTPASMPAIPALGAANSASSSPVIPAIASMGAAPAGSASSSPVIPAIPSMGAANSASSSPVMPAIPSRASGMMSAVPSAAASKPPIPAPSGRVPAPKPVNSTAVKPPSLPGVPKVSVSEVMETTPTLENAPDYQTAASMMAQTKEKVHKPYVAPAGIPEPPKMDDGDSIEIGYGDSIEIGYGDEEDVTRKYSRSDFNRNK